MNATATSQRVITRADGCSFVLRPFRQQLAATSRRDLSRQLKEITVAHGNYCHIQRELNREFVVAVHDTAGQLLGETIARHFDYPAYLVWCEIAGDESAVNEETQVLTVVISGGRVQVDKLVPLAELSAELALALKQDGQRYQCVIDHRLPISGEPVSTSVATLIIDPEWVGDLTQPDTPLFSVISIDEADALRSPVDAVAQAGFRSYIPYITAAVLFLVITAIVYMAPSKPTSVAVVTDPFSSYRTAMQTPAPTAQILAMLDNAVTTFSLHRWAVAGINLTPSGQTLVLVPVSKLASQGDLLVWGEARHWSPVFKGTSAEITVPTVVSSRPAMDVITPLPEAVARFADAIVINPALSLTMNEHSQQQQIATQSVSVSLNGAAWSDLVFIAQAIDGLPATLNSGLIKNDAFELSGLLTFTFYGY